MARRTILAVVMLMLITTACSAADSLTAEEEAPADGATAADVGGATAADVGGPLHRTGTLRLETAHDTFNQTYAEAIAVADRFGAEIVHAVTDQQPDALPTGSLTILVTDDRYTAVVAAMAQLGRVSSQRIDASRGGVAPGVPPGSEDVTGRLPTYSQLLVEISEPRGLASTARMTWGVAWEVMLYSVQAVMLLLAFAVPILIAVVLLRLGLWAWRRVLPATTSDGAGSEGDTSEAERRPSGVGA